MIPFVAFPFAGVLSNKEVAQAYGHWLILPLLGGFLLSAGMEKSGVHRRIALGIMRMVGTGGPTRIILGMMLATWIFERLDFKYRNNLDDAARRARFMRTVGHSSNQASTSY